MKLILTLTLLTFVQSTQVFAAVQLVKSCQVASAGLHISIFDNQGIGRVRTSNLMASVTDTQGHVQAEFPVFPPPANGSISFGRSPYTDKATHGKKFVLAFPSTNFRHTSVFVSFPNSQTFASDDVVCTF